MLKPLPLVPFDFIFHCLKGFVLSLRNTVQGIALSTTVIQVQFISCFLEVVYLNFKSFQTILHGIAFQCCPVWREFETHQRLPWFPPDKACYSLCSVLVCFRNGSDLHRHYYFFWHNRTEININYRLKDALLIALYRY